MNYLRTFKKLFGSERGAILVMALLIQALLMGAGVGAIVSVQTDLKISSNLKTGRQAFYLADAGVNRAWEELDDSDGINDFDSLSGTKTLFSEVRYGAGSYSVTAEVIVGSSPKRINVTSTGCLPAADPCTLGNSKAVIKVQFRRESSFKCAVCAKDSVVLFGGSTTDSYDSRKGFYGESKVGINGEIEINIGSDGDVRSNGSVMLSVSGTTVNGDTTAGSTVTLGRGTTITGTINNLAPPQELPSVPACGPPYSDGAGITGGSYDASNGKLEGTGSDSITLANGTYCFKSVRLNGGSTLTIYGPVNIYVTGDSDFIGGGVINTTSLPENFKIFSSFSSAILGIKVSGGSQAYMVIYAPDSKVLFLGGGDFYGSAVGRHVATIGDAIMIHYDKKLEDTTDSEVDMISWQRVF